MICDVYLWGDLGYIDYLFWEKEGGGEVLAKRVRSPGTVVWY